MGGVDGVGGGRDGASYVSGVSLSANNRVLIRSSHDVHLLITAERVLVVGLRTHRGARGVDSSSDWRRTLQCARTSVTWMMTTSKAEDTGTGMHDSPELQVLCCVVGG